MLSIQHVLSLVLKCNNDKEYLNTYLAATVYPDAIRAYSGPRPYSHFERSSIVPGDVSYWEIPSYMKLSKEDIQESLKISSHLAEYKPSVLGEKTDINAFRYFNQHLPENMYKGIEIHLKQDIVFDDFIRKVIDCSDMYNDSFAFNGQTMNGQDVRKLIAQIEQYGIYSLVHKIYELTGTLCNQEWLKENVKPILDRDYSQDLSDKTFSYMNIDSEIDAYITAKDWSHINDGPLDAAEYDTLYDDVTAYLENSRVREASNVKEIRFEELQEMFD